MLFRLLGPLEVDDGDHPLPLGEGRHRTVLVLLLLHRNEAVPSERLIDALWGEAPPPTAAKVLQNHVSRLRRALGDREGQRLQTRGRGYLLAVDGGEVDVDRFEALVREGGEALADERAADARARLLEALALWRGPPLAEVAYEEFAQAEIARLEEQHATAVEQRIDADLALGRHADVVAELEGLVAEHPLRERLRAQLMIALYRCGRQADALEVYNAGRETLRRRAGGRAGAGAARAAGGDPAPGSGPRAGAGRLAAAAPGVRRRIALLAAGGALLLGAAGAAALVAGGGEDVRVRLGANAVGAFDPGSGALTGAVDVGPSPSHLAADGRTLWVTNADGQSVSRVDADDRAVEQTVTVGSGPAGVAVASDAVWVANSRDGTVSRIDATTNAVVDRIPVGTNPTGVAAGAGAVWVANSGDRTISRIDPRSGQVTTIDVNAEPTELAVGDGAVWMTSASSRTVSRIDPAFAAGGGVAPGRRRPGRHRLRTRRRMGRQHARRHRLADRPGHRRRDRDDLRRQRAERDRRRPRRRLGRRGVRRRRRPHRPRHPARRRADRRREPADGPRPCRRQPVGRRPQLGHGASRRDAAPAGHGSSTRSSRHSPTATQSSPFVGGDRRRPHRPAARRRAGRHPGRARPRGHAARRAQDGGRTYRFVLRPGHPLLDRRRGRGPGTSGTPSSGCGSSAVPRAASAGRDFLATIAGAEQCTREPSTCDLSRGIVTEGDSVVTFHLTRPIPSSSTSSRCPSLRPAGGDAAASRRT